MTPEDNNHLKLKEKVMKTRSHTQKVVMASVAAICVAFAAVAAHADDTLVNAPKRTVHYADLNLNTQAGISVLYSRIRNAAEQVCGDVNSRRLEEAREAEACVVHAVQVSVRSVNNARLTNEFNAHFAGAAKSINLASIH
jgi:UrcA family protein